MRPLVVSIDSSTTACKAIAWNSDGQAVAEGRSSYALLQPAPNWYEQDAEQWWTATRGAVRQLLDSIDPGQVDALCITHQRESFVPVSGDGTPTRNAILWLDERSRDQVALLEREVGRERFHAVTGKPLTTNPSITKIAWLLQHEPESVSSAHKVLDAHAFLVHRLTGEFRTSLASADPTGLIDVRVGDWSDEMLGVLKLQPRLLPELVPPGTPIGCVSTQAAAETGLPAGLLIVAGAGDGQCAGLGVNAASGGRASLSLGTGVVSGATSEDCVISPAFRTLYAASGKGYFLETVIQGGAFTLSWFVDSFCADLVAAVGSEDAIAAWEEPAIQLPPGAGGLVLVPYWKHAMTPYWDAAASGITIGWTGAHTPAHLFRAILEGIAFEQRLVGEGVARATGKETIEYIVTGGGSRSDLWCQIIADVTSIPIRRAAATEATSLGAGIVAAAAVGWYPDVESAAEAMTRTTDVFRPDAKAATVYNELYTDVYRHLFPRVQSLLHRLADIRDSVAHTEQYAPRSP